MTAPNRSHGKLNTAWEKMCLNKSRFADEYAARATISYILTQPSKDGTPRPTKMWVYKCQNCRGWHLTSSRVRNSTPVTLESLV